MLGEHLSGDTVTWFGRQCVVHKKKEPPTDMAFSFKCSVFLNANKISGIEIKQNVQMIKQLLKRILLHTFRRKTPVGF